MPKTLVIDNYDSFVYNLVQYLGELGSETLVIRNDEYSDDEIITKIENDIKPSHILISPGPGKPKDSGISQIIIKELAGKLPILGVCLGHQTIGEIYGALVTKAPSLMHGKTSEIEHKSKHALFKDIPESFTATRYHSLVIDYASMQASPAKDLLQIEAKTADDVVMAVSHKDYPNLMGVQYHPESILSEYGHKLLANFLAID